MFEDSSTFTSSDDSISNDLDATEAQEHILQKNGDVTSSFIKRYEECLNILIRAIDQQRTLIDTVAASIASLTDEQQELQSLNEKITRDIGHLYREEIHNFQMEELMNDYPPLLDQIWPKRESSLEGLLSGAEEIIEKQLAIEAEISRWTSRLAKVEEQWKWNKEAASTAMRQIEKISSSLPSVEVKELEELVRQLNISDLSLGEKVTLCAEFSFVNLIVSSGSEDRLKEDDEEDK